MKNLALILFIVFILAYINQMDKMTWVSFNWFNIPNTEELYLVEYPKNVSEDIMHFEVYSSKNYPCSVYICSSTIDKPLVAGYNIINVSMGGCGKSVQTILSCGESEVRFSSQRINRSFSAESL